MSLFPETIAAALAGGKVEVAPLVRFDFTNSTMRLWRGGIGEPLNTNDGEVWTGLGLLGSMRGIEQSVNGTAPEASFTLSWVQDPDYEGDDILALARDEFEAEVRGRPATVLVQFFGVDDPDDPDNQRPLDNPFAIWSGRGLRPTFEFDRASGQRSVTISYESLFSLRSRPPHSMYTDADQQARFPEEGDRGFEMVGSLVNKVVTWPDW